MERKNAVKSYWFETQCLLAMIAGTSGVYGKLIDNSWPIKLLVSTDT